MTPEAFREGLYELGASASSIAADPGGASWLDDELRRAAAADPACAEVLEEYVEFELAGFSELTPKDRTFSARVARTAEASLPVARRRVLRRAAILAAFHGLAIAVAVLWFMGAPTEPAAIASSASVDVTVGDGANLGAAVQQLREAAHGAIADSRDLGSSLGWLTLAAVAFLLLRNPAGLSRWSRG